MSSPLTDELMGSFKLAKVFHDCNNPITSLEFSADGEALIVGCPKDESIHLYDPINGKSVKEIYSKKYGVGIVRFTHRKTNVLYSGTKGEDVIRYLSLHDNAYLRYFHGHDGPISALEMSPLDDTFMSGARNDTVRIWDLRSPSCAGALKCEGRPMLAIDPQGVVFAVALNNRHIRLYDLKNFADGPFAAFEVVDDQRPDNRWTSLKFSPDGKDLLINAGPLLYQINSFDGTLRSTITAPNSLSLSEASYTPDGMYVLAGTDDRKVRVWRREDGKAVAELEGHSGRPGCVKFNPTRQMIASACSNLAFWIPEL